MATSKMFFKYSIIMGMSVYAGSVKLELKQTKGIDKIDLTGGSSKKLYAWI